MLRSAFLLFIGLLFLNAEAAAEQCPLRASVYESGAYELHFDKEEQSATFYPFKIVNTQDNVSFSGFVTWGNGYSTPDTAINVCDKDVKSNVPDELKDACGWVGVPYELDGVNTHFAFESTRNENNPILFPVLHKKLTGVRSLWDIENKYSIERPSDIWTFKECKNN